MNDETPINEENVPVERERRLPDNLQEPVERAGFAFQERVIWPLQDRFGDLLPETNRKTLLGGGAAAAVAGVAVAIALTSGGGSSSTPTSTAAEAPSPREPLAAITAPTDPKSQPQPRQEPPGETLHGAAPVFSPPSPASKGGEETGGSKAAAAGADGSADSNAASASSEAGSANADASDSGAASDSGTGTAADSSSGDSPSPAAARISSDPENSATAANDSDPTAGAAAARPAVADGPPAGPAALKVAREFAKGFVVYETGGEASDFEDAFRGSATPELTKALLQRPPKQPAGVKVPRAKLLNVVAGPSRGKVYKVSVSLLRVGVTSELRLDMEKTVKGKRVEWRVTNVLG